MASVQEIWHRVHRKMVLPSVQASAGKWKMQITVDFPIQNKYYHKTE